MLIVGAGAIVCSVFTAYTCDFFEFRTLDGEPWDQLFAPFDNVSSSHVGFFRYSSSAPSSSSNGEYAFGRNCQTYDDWRSLDSESKLFPLSQYASAAAPGAALLAWMINFIEVTCHQAKSLYLLTAFLLLAATILQGCTFLIFSESDFCLESESLNECSLGIGVYYSAAATCAYLFMTLLTCAMPTSNPCCPCGNTSGDGDEDEEEESQQSKNAGSRDNSDGMDARSMGTSGEHDDTSFREGEEDMPEGADCGFQQKLQRTSHEPRNDAPSRATNDLSMTPAISEDEEDLDPILFPEMCCGTPNQVNGFVEPLEPRTSSSAAAHAVAPTNTVDNDAMSDAAENGFGDRQDSR